MNNNESPVRSYAFTPALTLKLSKRWVLSTISVLLSGRRFVSLTPPICRKQTILDRYTKKLITINIRDVIDWETLQQIYVQQDYDLNKLQRSKDISNYYNSLISNNVIPLIIDCGANIGLAAKYFSQAYTKAKIIAVEPDVENLKQAQLNNSFGDVSFIQAAVASSDTRGKLIDLGFGNNAFRVSEERDGSLQMVSINSLLKDIQIEKMSPFIIKIDIEGYESELFSKNTEWVEKFPVLIIELHDRILPRQGSSRSFLNIISKLDRDFVYYGENIFSISNKLL